MPAASSNATDSDRRPATGNKPFSVARDILHAAVLVVAASLLGLTTNAFSKNPIIIMDPKGPGSLPPEAPVISLAEFKKVRESGEAVLLDARSDRLLGEGVPIDAIRATPQILRGQDFFNSFRTLFLTAKKVVVLCDSDGCSTGDRMVQILSDWGVSTAVKLEGGWPAYQNSGLPLRGQTP